MDTIIIDARLTKEGKIEIELPKGWQEGNIRVEITLEKEQQDIPWEEQPWTNEELDAALQFKGQTLGEILESGLIGTGADWDIGDSAEWVAEQRRKRVEESEKLWKE